MSTADLLIEIGCEELPPKALAQLGAHFARAVGAGLHTRGLIADASAARGLWSPRRLAVQVAGVLVQQPERGESLTGPAEKAAFDAAGKPTKAAEGFAAKCGVPVDQLQRKDGKLHFERRVPGRPTRDLLAELVVAALDGLPIPKRMRWGAGDTAFARPVHWVVLLLGEHAIEADIYGVRSGRHTRGHRFQHRQPIALKAAGDYAAALLAAGVRLNDADHSLEAEIRQQAAAKAKAAGGTLLAPALADGGLISEVAALCEWPVVLEGRFDARFLDLPEEVLVSTIEGNQRYFLMREGLLSGADGRLLPRFLFVANLESKDPAVVIAGNERVIVPRLTDAVFFWDQDRQQPLAARGAGLADIVFQKDLGSYAGKRQRVKVLAERIAADIGGDAALAGRAAELAKCDLLTSLVGEFPDLQGTIGRHLARHDGEPAEVCTALEEQYRPRFAGDALPSTRTGQALALADKLDTLTGIFRIGQKPTGDKDPFALRRQALGILRIILDGRLDLDLSALLGLALGGDAGKSSLDEVYDFLLERLRGYYLEAGVRADVFAAVAAQRPPRPLDFDARIKAISGFLDLPEWQPLAAANKRIANILRQAGGAPDGKVDTALLQDPAEKALHAVLDSGEVAWIEGLLETRSYDAALKKLAALKDPVDAFFDGVMVMAEDPGVRANRLRLLARVQALFLHVGDIGQLQVE